MKKDLAKKYGEALLEESFSSFSAEADLLMSMTSKEKAHLLSFADAIRLKELRAHLKKVLEVWTEARREVIDAKDFV